MVREQLALPGVDLIFCERATYSATVRVVPHGDGYAVEVRLLPGQIDVRGVGALAERSPRPHDAQTAIALARKWVERYRRVDAPG